MIVYSLFSVIKTSFCRIALRGVRIGNRSIIDFETRIWALPSSNISIGDNVHLRSRQYKYHAGMVFPTTLYAESTAIITIGDNSRLNGSFIHASEKVEIGKNCVLAAGVQILDKNGHIVSSSDRTKGSDQPNLSLLRIMFGLVLMLLF